MFNNRSSVIQRSNRRVEYSVTRTVIHFIAPFPPGVTQECLCPTLWKEVWWRPTAGWCRATRSCRSMARTSGRPRRRPWLHCSRYVYRTCCSEGSTVSEWHICFCWMTILGIICLVLQCCVGPIKMEVGRFKAGPFHSERRLSQCSQVMSFHMFKGALCNFFTGLQVNKDKK